MIASLRGTLLERTPGTCVVEAGGVGYLVQVSGHTASGLPAAGQPVFLRTRQVVREDAVQLFGFGDAEELELFELMIGVSGVGPKLALAVLSGLRPPALRRAIREEQVGLLTGVPGIGKKTAERLLLELKGKLPVASMGAAKVSPGGTASPVVPDALGDILNALLALGYNEREALGAMKSLPPDVGVSDGIRHALKLLAKA